MSIDRLVDTVGQGVGKTFAVKRIQSLAGDLWRDVMDPMGDIFKNAIDMEKTKANDPVMAKEGYSYLTSPS